MSATDRIPEAEQERRRLLQEYARRDRQYGPGGDGRYAPDHPVEAFMRAGRRRRAVALLRDAGAFPPQPGDRCLEVGYGRLGWLADLLSWGVRIEDLHGIELDETRAQEAQRRFPGADLRVGDATAMPWPDGHFHLVVASTVFTSILDSRVRSALAEEISRVLAPGGALLFYDFRYNNPANPQVRKVTRRELFSIFPRLRGPAPSVTLAPPLARRLVPWSPWVASALEALPPLRSHLVAVLRKEPEAS